MSYRRYTLEEVEPDPASRDHAYHNSLRGWKAVDFSHFPTWEVNLVGSINLFELFLAICTKQYHAFLTSASGSNEVNGLHACHLVSPRSVGHTECCKHADCSV